MYMRYVENTAKKMHVKNTGNKMHAGYAKNTGNKVQTGYVINTGKKMQTGCQKHWKNTQRIHMKTKTHMSKTLETKHIHSKHWK